MKQENYPKKRSPAKNQPGSDRQGFAKVWPRFSPLATIQLQQEKWLQPQHLEFFHLQLHIFSRFQPEARVPRRVFLKWVGQGHLPPLGKLHGHVT
jgi:hypothetical protein